MLPILHLHHVHTIHHSHLYTAQKIRAPLLLALDLETKRTRNQDIAFHQLLLVRRHHHHSPCLSGDLDPYPEVVIAVSFEIDKVVDGKVLACVSRCQRVFDVGGDAERVGERPLVLDLGTGRGEGE